ncbi:hypothetical protein R3P38DRAFT_3539319 [Favolaschia claudopus]|uniref:Uncharacterized protein n=1 Tax=Favolaschia claudopus TaxID=2862362 RepID=A0AAW0B9C5_9AGAR
MASVFGVAPKFDGRKMGAVPLPLRYRDNAATFCAAVDGRRRRTFRLLPKPPISSTSNFSSSKAPTISLKWCTRRAFYFISLNSIKISVSYTSTSSIPPIPTAAVAVAGIRTSAPASPSQSVPVLYPVQAGHVSFARYPQVFSIAVVSTAAVVTNGNDGSGASTVDGGLQSRSQVLSEVATMGLKATTAVEATAVGVESDDSGIGVTGGDVVGQQAHQNAGVTEDAGGGNPAKIIGICSSGIPETFYVKISDVTEVTTNQFTRQQHKRNGSQVRNSSDGGGRGRIDGHRPVKRSGTVDGRTASDRSADASAAVNSEARGSPGQGVGEVSRIGREKAGRNGGGRLNPRCEPTKYTVSEETRMKGTIYLDAVDRDGNGMGETTTVKLKRRHEPRKRVNAAKMPEDQGAACPNGARGVVYGTDGGGQQRRCDVMECAAAVGGPNAQRRSRASPNGRWGCCRRTFRGREEDGISKIVNEGVEPTVQAGKADISRKS